jgi:hypothetical protein
LKEAYLGTKLTLARGLGAEMSYVEWCEEAAKMISSLEQHPMDGPRTSSNVRWIPGGPIREAARTTLLSRSFQPLTRVGL